MIQPDVKHVDLWEVWTKQIQYSAACIDANSISAIICSILVSIIGLVGMIRRKLADIFPLNQFSLFGYSIYAESITQRYHCPLIIQLLSSLRTPLPKKTPFQVRVSDSATFSLQNKINLILLGNSSSHSQVSC